MEKLEISYQDVNLWADFFSKSFENFNSVYSSKVNMSILFLDKGLDFFADTFKGKVNINYCKLGGRSSFANDIFNETLILDGLSGPDSASISFDNALLPDTIFICENKFKGEIDLLNSDFKHRTKPIQLYFYRSNLARIKLDYLHFKILLPDSLGLLSRKKDSLVFFNYDDKTKIFEQLLETFKMNGQTDSYRLCDVEYMLFKWRNRWAGFMPCIPYLWNEFGYKKERVFLWSFWFLILFTIINVWLLDYLNSNIYPMTSIPFTKRIRNPFRRVWYSFVYTSAIFFRLTLKIENINFQKILGSMYLMIIYTLGIVCLAYMAGYVLQK